MTDDRPAEATPSRTRRRLLATAAVAAVPLTAGCQIGAPDGNDARSANGPADEGSDDDPVYNAAMASIDDHPVTEPLEFEDGQRCPVCNMQPPDYPRWNCQLAHGDGTGLFFDSPGCLLAYYVVTESHPTDAAIERLWFTEFGTFELFEAAEGFLVRETEFAGLSNPMSGSPLPFATRDDASAYVADAAHLDDAAIVPADEIDRELAAFYRDNRMPDA